MFQGSSAITLDAKGRISVPTRHRDALVSQAGGKLTLTRHPDGCLLMYPRPVWEERREQIARFPMSARALQRLRTAAGLKREVMMLGLGEHYELWYAEALARSEAEAFADGMPEALKDFSF